VRTRAGAEMDNRIRILYEDNHLLCVFKPGGLLVQGDRTGDTTALELAKRYIKEKYGKPGNVFLGLVHRIDRPASGVVVFARTSKAASRLSREFHDRKVKKTYLAVVWGRIAEDQGELVSYIERAHLRSRVADGPSASAKQAVLHFTVLARREDLTLVEVSPATGRHHQIRLQFARAGHPVVGDLKYGATAPLPDKTIALHATSLTFEHPVREEPVTISAPPPTSYPWSLFGVTIADRFAPREPERRP
jgi:23S rRNA pseudouridine1911/1915/1917 synthase